MARDDGVSAQVVEFEERWQLTIFFPNGFVSYFVPQDTLSFSDDIIKRYSIKLPEEKKEK